MRGDTLSELCKGSQLRTTPTSAVGNPEAEETAATSTTQRYEHSRLRLKLRERVHRPAQQKPHERE